MKATETKKYDALMGLLKTLDLDEEQANWVRGNPDPAFRAIQRALKDRSSLFGRLIRSVEIPARKKDFVAEDFFILNRSLQRGVRICNMKGRFQRCLLEIVEPPEPKHSIYYRPLNFDNSDQAIIKRLGGAEKASITLFDLSHVMRLHRLGESHLNCDGQSRLGNIFFIRDINGVLRRVEIRWIKNKGWEIFADEICCPDGGRDGFFVFHNA